MRAVLGEGRLVFCAEAGRAAAGAEWQCPGGVRKGGVSPWRREGVGMGRGSGSCHTGVPALSWLGAISLTPAACPAVHFSSLGGRAHIPTHPPETPRPDIPPAPSPLHAVTLAGHTPDTHSALQ